MDGSIDLKLWRVRHLQDRDVGVLPSRRPLTRYAQRCPHHSQNGAIGVSHGKVCRSFFAHLSLILTTIPICQALRPVLFLGGVLTRRTRCPRWRLCPSSNPRITSRPSLISRPTSGPSFGFQFRDSGATSSRARRAYVARVRPLSLGGDSPTSPCPGVVSVSSFSATRGESCEGGVSRPRAYVRIHPMRILLLLTTNLSRLSFLARVDFLFSSSSHPTFDLSPRPVF
jgi:hypothetical protein